MSAIQLQPAPAGFSQLRAIWAQFRANSARMRPKLGDFDRGRPELAEVGLHSKTWYGPRSEGRIEQRSAHIDVRSAGGMTGTAHYKTKLNSFIAIVASYSPLGSGDPKTSPDGQPPVEFRCMRSDMRVAKWRLAAAFV